MKKIAMALLLVLLLVAPQALAANLPQFATLEDAGEYLIECVATAPESIELNLLDLEQQVEETDWLDQVRTLTMQYRVDAEWDTDTGWLKVMPEYYPGTKVAAAVLTGDDSRLTAEERTLRDRALEIVRDAKARSSTMLDLELALHDWLCANVNYEAMPEERPTMPRVCTATGAVLDGRANCQGYADAFYMLGRLAGLDVRCQDGIDGDGFGHRWNVVRCGDVWYIVDVTHDDVQDTNAWHYYLLNVGRDLCDHTWRDDEEVAPVERVTDANGWYYTAPGYGAASTDISDLASHAYFARRDDGRRVSQMALLNRSATWVDLDDAIMALATERGKRCSWYIWCRNYGGNTYYHVEWTQW